MAPSPHKVVSTLEALINSIDNDNQVYRWFAFLVGQPSIRSKYGKGGLGRDLYRNLDHTMSSQRVVAVFVLFLVGSSLYMQEYTYLWLNILFLYPLWKLRRERRRWVKEISTQILVHDFEPTELRQKTLYQLSELYSRKYNIPSFVDAIYFADSITRKSMILAVLCLPFVLEMNLWQAVLVVVGAYYLPYLIANHPAVFKYLK